MVKKITLVLLLLVIVGGAYLIGKGERSLFKKTSKPKKAPNTVQDWADQYSSTLTDYCHRDKPFPLKPEFNRSLSLLTQRLIPESEMEKWKNGEGSENQFFVIIENQKCLNIIYASTEEEMQGAEGLFFFDRTTSGPSELKILVSPKYLVQDDIVTALLLSHELSHAIQFIYEDSLSRTVDRCKSESDINICSELKSGITFPDCVEKEVDAFYNQLWFFFTLKESERDSFLLRAKQGASSKLHQSLYYQATEWNSMVAQCPLQPGDDGRIWKGCIRENIRQSIRTNPGYQEQCGLN